MKLTLGELKASFDSNALPRLAADAGLPVKTAFRLAQVWKQALAQMQCYEEARINICRKYGTLNEETQKFEFPNDDAEKELHKEGRELLRIEVEIGGEPFLIDDFGPRKLTAGDFLSANDIVHLGWLIVEERSEPVSAAATAAASAVAL